MKDVKEYLRRNQVHCKSVGIMAGIEAALRRLKKNKKQCKWLIKALEVELSKTNDVCCELAVHRNEVGSY